MTMLYFDAFTRFGAKPRQHPAQRWTLEHLVDDMRRSGIAGAMVMHTAQTLGDPLLGNRRLLELIAGQPRLRPIWVLMPDLRPTNAEPVRQLAAMDAAGVRMAALFPRTHGWSLVSAWAQPLLDALETARQLTLLEYGTEVDARELEEVATRHPHLPLLLRGVHWSQTRLVVPLLRTYRNLHLCFDTFQANRGVEWLTAQGLEDQLVFASNAVDMSIGAHRTTLDYADIAPATRAKIAGGTLCRLLGVKPWADTPAGEPMDALVAAAQRGEPLPPPVYDFHAHVLEEGSVDAGGANVMWDGGPCGLRAMARRLGIEGVGVMSWSGTVGAQGQEGNRCVQAALDAHPDVFWGLARFDPIHETGTDLEHAMEALFRDPRWLGLKPYPSYGLPYSDSRYDAWWRFAQAHGLYCGLHPVNWYQSGEFESVCSRFPGLTVVAYHCGADFGVADTTTALAKRFANLHLEITFTPVWSGMVEYLVQGAGPDRVLFGTDQPMRDPRPQLGWVLYADLPVEQKQQVLGGNARKLLGRWLASGRKGVLR